MSRYGTPLQCAVGGFLVFSDVEPLSRGLCNQFSESRLQSIQRENTVELLLNAGAQATLRVYTPVMRSSLLSLAAYNVQFSFDFETIERLIRFGIDVDEEDLPSFAQSYGFIKKIWKPPVRFKHNFEEGKAVLSLLDALRHRQSSELPRRAEDRLYQVTLSFAREMELDIPKDLVESSIDDQDPRKFILSAIEANDVALLESFPSFRRCEVVELVGVDAERPDWTPLHVAVNAKSLDSLKILLDWGCDPNATGKYGVTPVHLCGDDEHEEFLRALLRYGASTVALNNESGTIWHISSRFSSLRILNILYQQDNQNSTRQKVSDMGDTPVDLQHLTDLELKDKNQETPMHHAARSGSVSSVEFLAERGGNVDAVSASGKTPLHLAVQHRHVGCIKALLNQSAKQRLCNAGCSPLIYAYITGDAAIVQALQTRLNSLTVSASTISIQGARKMADSLRMAIQQNDIGACKRIHALGCSVDVEIHPGRLTPLVFAIYQKRGSELVQWLLNNNAKVSTLTWHSPRSLYLTAAHLALAYPVFNPLLSILVSRYLDEGGEFSARHPNPMVIAIGSRNTEGLLEFLSILKHSRQAT
ncbi:hypothetical protein NW762_010217 [Fusarium torreyae]|uniref:Ankyrin repeat protein n=1 Tax=Fusarium torreyae TaxID=1237075 RepID=A0A9W8RUH2_9HYPO|nr:hypothetical protein NW762_010217 [Fusarium torreyae]